jgi:hypothetical protein
MPAEYDVFLSHAWADGDRPREIAQALEAAGLRVWFDAKEIADFEGITRVVQQGLAKSKALLAYYSKAYPTRRACQWELTAAFLAAQQEGDPRRREKGTWSHSAQKCTFLHAQFWCSFRL